MLLRPVLALAAAWVALSAPAAATALSPTAQDRSVSGSGSASDSATFDSDSDSHAAPDFAPFNQGASAQVTLSGALGAGSAHQNSSITATAIQATGGHAANGEGWEEFGYGDGSGQSHFQVTFTVDSAVDYTLTGSLEAFDNGDTQIQFTGPGGDLYSDWANGIILPVNGSGTLAAGTYTLLIDSQGSAYGDWFSYGYSSGYYDITLQLPAVSAPVPGSGAALTLGPNPFRSSTRLSLAEPATAAAEWRVYDAAGRLVTELSGERGVRTVVWDGTDAGGRPVPAGVYFLRGAEIPGPALRVTRLR